MQLLFENLAQFGHQRGIEFEKSCHGLFHLFPRDRIDIHLGFPGVGEKFRILHRIHESFLQDLHAIFRRAWRQRVGPGNRIGVVNRGLNITWTCNARADVDLETLKWLKKAGCKNLPRMGGIFRPRG